MSKVLMPQMGPNRSSAVKQPSSAAASTSPILCGEPLSSPPSKAKSCKNQQNLHSIGHSSRYNSSNGSSFPATPSGYQRQRYSSPESPIIASEPQSPTQLLDFDDLNSTSSIMEFLRQEQNCAASQGHDSETDAESIFQEVSRLADSTDTRSVDELLREAEKLMNNQQFMGQHHRPRQQQPRKPSPKLRPGSAPNQKPAQAPSILMNSKYTKSIENVNPPDAMSKSINGFAGGKVGSFGECSSQLMTPETPTAMTHSLTESTTAGSGGGGSGSGNTFNNFANNIMTESVISEESTPLDFPEDNTATITQCSSNDNTTGKDITTKQMDGDDSDDSADTIAELAEAMESMELIVQDTDELLYDPDSKSSEMVFSCTSESLTTGFNDFVAAKKANRDSLNQTNSSFSSISSIVSARVSDRLAQHQPESNECEFPIGRRPSCEATSFRLAQQQQQQQQTLQKQAVSSPNLLASPQRQLAAGATNATERCSSGSYLGRRSSMTTPDSGICSQTHLPGTSTAALLTQRSSSPIMKSARSYCDKSVNSSPVVMVSRLTSPITDHSQALVSVSREHALKQEIEQLQERLKDTEERLESFRLQHDTVSQLHRKLRESNTQLQEESEVLKLDVQHLNECANVLRAELQAARNDRDEAKELQKMLQNELEETRAEKKRACEQKEKDAKTIQDLQRQCREMERILMRKHPDSVSALIVASRSNNMSSSNDQENVNSRKLLEQRIAQLEADAKEQDYKAQQILANVQARFNSVQAKYETHIADLETQVLSLQEINTKLNEKIESQVRTLDYFVSKKAEKFYNNCTQTEEQYVPAANISTPAAIAAAAPAPAAKPRKICRKTISTQTAASTRESGTNTIGTSSQHSASSSTSSTANSTPNNSRPNSKQSGLRKPVASATANHLTSAVASKLPVSQSDNTISLSAAQAALNAKEDAHLVATIRGMRVDLAIKNKALQRLTRELDECKKTIKKIQKDKEAFKYYSTAASGSGNAARMNMDHMPASTESQALKEAQNKYKLLEADYKSLHDKRLQDLKTLQTAHERELASCHETVRILQQRLNERDEQFAMQKRRKVPVDYYALKAKVSSLERRHTEREERLHMLVEALSKGRLNGALDDLLGDNNNQ